VAALRTGGAPLTWQESRGAAPFGFKGAGFESAFFLFVLHPQKPFTRPNNRSTANFDRSLQST
jgi:hypothetical protein